MSTCPMSGPASSTAIGSTGRSSRPKATDSTRARCSWTPTPRRSAATSRWDKSLFGYDFDDAAEDLSKNDQDSAAFAPLARVIDPAFDWGDDRHPNTAWHKTVIYEAHVKGFTKKNPAIPEPIRGTYAAIASDAAIGHLKTLGVTAIELLPIHYHLDDSHLEEKGLVNYWGYNSIGYLAPNYRYAQDDPVREFKTMVKALHAAGIEVILDVVYNHTAEGNQKGPTLSMRGIDNVSYYMLSPEDPRFYMDFTGCGNVPNMSHPRVLQLIMDSLRYWVTEMHVDGFRFDLASTLARELHEINRLGTFFDIIHQDPVISQVKLIAEPWDVGPGGYQVGNFPVLWTEWNGKYRDCAAQVADGQGGGLADGRLLVDAQRRRQGVARGVEARRVFLLRPRQLERLGDRPADRADRRLADDRVLVLRRPDQRGQHLLAHRADLLDRDDALAPVLRVLAGLEEGQPVRQLLIADARLLVGAGRGREAEQQHSEDTTRHGGSPRGRHRAIPPRIPARRATGKRIAFALYPPPHGL